MLPSNAGDSHMQRTNSELHAQSHSLHSPMHNGNVAYSNNDSLSDDSFNYSHRNILPQQNCAARHAHRDNDACGNATDHDESAAVREEDALSLLEMMQRKFREDCIFYTRQNYQKTLWGDSSAYVPSAEDTAGIFQKMYYTWIESHVKLAAKEQLSLDVIPHPTQDVRAHSCGMELAHTVQSATRRRYAWSALLGAQVRSTLDETSLGVLRWVGIPQQGGFTNVMAAVEWVQPPQSALAAHRAHPDNSPFFSGTLHGERLFTPRKASSPSAAAAASYDHDNADDISCLATLENPRQLDWVAAARGSEAAAVLSTPIRISLFTCLFQSMPQYVLWQFPFKLLGDACTLSIPMLLSMYVKYLSDSREHYRQSAFHGFVIVLGLFFVQATQSVALHRFYYISIKCGLQYRSALSTLIFEKCFLISRRALTHPEINAGRVINMVSNDVERVRAFMEFCMYVWSSPLILVVSTVLLARLVGWCAISAVVAMCIWAPINSHLMRRILALRRELASATDARVKATNEFLSGIRIAKMMAWEPRFIASIERRRAVEVDYVRRVQHYRVIISFINSATPILMIAAVFVLYAWTGNEITPSIVFPAISLLGIIRMPFMMIPFALTNTVNMMVSLSRIRRFIECDDRVFTTRAGVDTFLRATDSAHNFAPENDREQRSGEARSRTTHVNNSNRNCDNNMYDDSIGKDHTDFAAIFEHADIVASVPQKLPTMPRVRVATVVKILRRVLCHGWRPARPVMMHGCPIDGNSADSCAAAMGSAGYRGNRGASDQDDSEAEEREDGAAEHDDGHDRSRTSSSFQATRQTSQHHDCADSRSRNSHSIDGSSAPTQNNGKSKDAKPHDSVAGVKDQSSSSRSTTPPQPPTSMLGKATAVAAAAAATITAAGRSTKGERAEFHVLNDRVLLQDITFRIPTGKLTMIVGPTGAGKTVLLQSMLGQFEVRHGSVWASSHVAYVPQESWIMNATLRDNIIFFDKLNESALQQAIRVSQLQADVNMLIGGLDAEIGEKGINLSGGQKARVNLARAVYANRAVVLLDDPLSALDAHVGKRVMMDCILGALADKTRVLATHHLHVVPYADYVVALGGEGRVLFAGPREQFMHSAVYESLMTITQHEQHAAEGGAERSHSHPAHSDRDGRHGRRHAQHTHETDFSAPRRRHPTAMTSNHDSAGGGSTGAAIDDAHGDGDAAAPPIDPDNHSASWMDEDSSGTDTESVTGGKPRGNSFASATTAANAAGGSLIVQEEKAVGSVPFSTYRAYFEYCGGLRRVNKVLFIFVCTEILTMASTLWLSVWSESNVGDDYTSYMLVYIVLVVFAVSSTPLRFLVAFSTMRTGGVNLHRALLSSIASGTMQFFDTTPLGRIINRFSRDIDVVDDSLQMTMISFLSCAMLICSSLLITSLSQPFVLLIIVPAGYVYYKIMIFYNSANREVRRFGSLVKSPLFSLLGEVTQGMATIEAFGRSTVMMREACRRLDIVHATGHLENVANRWLGVRVEMLSIVAVTTIALSGLLSVELKLSWFSVGLVSLAVTMALQCTSNLNWFVRNAASVEADMNSVERLVYYSMNVDHESMPEVQSEVQELMSVDPQHNGDKYSANNNNNNNTDNRGRNTATDTVVIMSSAAMDGMAQQQQIAADDTKKGELQLREVQLRYRPDLPLVLRGVSFVIHPREKVGIVGRTGSGKSTLLLTFMRMVDICDGEIVVNGLPIGSYSLRQLRQLFSIIPQDPVLFEGTVRLNLDPFARYSSEMVWEALTVVGMRDRIAVEAEGIDSNVEEGGSNFSVGQRQLLCMARALLRQGSSFILMDEATANVDHKLDQQIQRTMMQAFREYTVIAIAHRLETIAPYDRVIVMDGGRVAEMGSPRQLVTRRGSMLSAMVAATGEEQSKRFLSLLQEA